MGTIADKLRHLRETVDLAKTFYKDMHHSERDNPVTLRNVLEWLIDCNKSFCSVFSYDRNGFLDKSTTTITTELANGDIIKMNSTVNSYFEAPPITYTGSVEFPFTFSGNGSGTNTSTMYHLGFSKVKARVDNGFSSYSFNCRYVTVRSMVYPEFFRMVNKQFSTYSLSGMFSTGLKLGRKCFQASSTWLSGSSVLTGEKYVDCMDNFEGTVYLSKVPMSADTMVRLFSKLKDLTGTGNSYTFNVGSENLAKLTVEQIAIAESKGWIIS